MHTCMNILYFKFVHDRLDTFCSLLETAVFFLKKVQELDQYAFLTAYSLLNKKKICISILEIVKSQRQFIVMLTHLLRHLINKVSD